MQNTVSVLPTRAPRQAQPKPCRIAETPNVYAVTPARALAEDYSYCWRVGSVGISFSASQNFFCVQLCTRAAQSKFLLFARFVRAVDPPTWENVFTRCAGTARGTLQLTALWPLEGPARWDLGRGSSGELA